MRIGKTLNYLWQMDLQELKEYFEINELPDRAELNMATVIIDIELFLKTNFIRANGLPGNVITQNALSDLNKLAEIMKGGAPLKVVE